MALVWGREATVVHQKLHRLGPISSGPQRGLPWLYSSAVIGGLLLMDVWGGLAYTTAAVVIGIAVFLLVRFKGSRAERTALVHLTVDWRDLMVMLGVYAVVVALYRVGFVVIVDNDLAAVPEFCGRLIDRGGGAGLLHGMDP